MSPAPPLLATERLTRSFGNLTAVDDVTLSVSRGEVVGLVGPNGAGKSTLLDIVGGFQDADRGTIRLLGQDVTGWAPERRARLGFARTFQRPRAAGELSALHNVLLAPMAQRGESWTLSVRSRSWQQEEAATRRQALDALELLELAQVAEMPAMALSFGQLKLLAFARAIATGAALLGLDEPVAGLAPHLREVVSAAIARNRGSRGYLIVEHDLDFLRGIADRIILMAQGRVLLDGTPADVLASEVALEAYLGV